MSDQILNPSTSPTDSRQAWSLPGRQAGESKTIDTNPVRARSRTIPLVVSTALIVALAVGGWWWFTHRAVIIPVQQLSDPAKPANLAGLNQPQKLDGSCIASYTINGLGIDVSGLQHYALSVQLAGNPADAAALAQLLTTTPCADQLGTIQEATKTKLGLEGKDGAAAQLSTSFKTKSGHRLFLP